MKSYLSDEYHLIGQTTPAHARKKKKGKEKRKKKKRARERDVGIDLGFEKIINASVSGGILKIFFYK